MLFLTKRIKKTIYKTLKGKSGVYVFINNITNEIYVGSSVDLTRRMRSYYYMADNSDKSTNSIIIRAFRKYGLNNFSLGIKEFCSPQDCIKLEQKWINYYKPFYNILDIAGNSLGFKHTPETIEKLKKLFLRKITL